MHKRQENLSIKELLELEKSVEKINHINKIPIYLSLPIAFKPLNDIFSNNINSCSFCAVKSIIGVIHSGEYALCGIGEHIPEMVFGEIEKDSLMEIWKNNNIIQYIRNTLEENFAGVCNQCIHKIYCIGACIAQNYYRTSNISQSFWFCEEADRLGLFPDSRKVPKKII